MSDTERLRAAVADLEESLTIAHDEIAFQLARFGMDAIPSAQRDTNGRFLLLDARAALVTGLSALAAQEGRW